MPKANNTPILKSIYEQMLQRFVEVIHQLAIKQHPGIQVPDSSSLSARLQTAQTNQPEYFQALKEAVKAFTDKAGFSLPTRFNLRRYLNAMDKHQSMVHLDQRYLQALCLVLKADDFEDWLNKNKNNLAAPLYRQQEKLLAGEMASTSSIFYRGYIYAKAVSAIRHGFFEFIIDQSDSQLSGVKLYICQEDETTNKINVATFDTDMHWSDEILHVTSRMKVDQKVTLHHLFDFGLSSSQTVIEFEKRPLLQGVYASVSRETRLIAGLFLAQRLSPEQLSIHPSKYQDMPADALPKDDILVKLLFLSKPQVDRKGQDYIYSDLANSLGIDWETFNQIKNGSYSIVLSGEDGDKTNYQLTIEKSLRAFTEDMHGHRETASLSTFGSFIRIEFGSGSKNVMIQLDGSFELPLKGHYITSSRYGSRAGKAQLLSNKDLEQG